MNQEPLSAEREMKALLESAYNGVCLASENGEMPGYSAGNVSAPDAGSFRVTMDNGTTFILSIQSISNENEDPLWRTLSEEDQETLAIIQIQEVHDCAKELAHEQLDAITDMAELQAMLHPEDED